MREYRVLYTIAVGTRRQGFSTFEFGLKLPRVRQVRLPVADTFHQENPLDRLLFQGWQVVARRRLREPGRNFCLFTDLGFLIPLPLPLRCKMAPCAKHCNVGRQRREDDPTVSCGSDVDLRKLESDPEKKRKDSLPEKSQW